MEKLENLEQPRWHSLEEQETLERHSWMVGWTNRDWTDQLMLRSAEMRTQHRFVKIHMMKGAGEVEPVAG